MFILKGVARKATKEEEMNLIITSIDSKYKFTIGSVCIEPKVLNTLLIGLNYRAEEILEMLLVGVSLPELRENDIVDDHTKQSFGFQMRFVNDGLKNLLLYHLYRDGQIKIRFFENPDVSIDNLVLNENEAKRYIKMHDQLCCLLSSLMHLTYGMPARSTEIYNLRFKNGSSPRNIYFAFGQIMIITRYNKINDITGRSNSIARFLPSSLSRMFCIFILVVRPLYLKLVSSVYGEQAFDESRMHLFYSLF